jgi:hypothetical protein
MTVVDDRVNSVLAAVLSASIAPIHGALAQEKTPSGSAGAPATRTPEKQKPSPEKIDSILELEKKISQELNEWV